MLGFKNFNFTGGQSTRIVSSAPPPVVDDFGLFKVISNPNAYGTSLGDTFSGLSLAMSDNYIIVGARNEDYTGGVNSGKAYIYSTADGSLLYTLDNPNAYGTPASDNFGSQVGICENYAIVGANGEDSASYSTEGKAYIYSTATGSLLYTLSDPNAYGTPASDQFGSQVAISNNYAIVASFNEDDAGGTDSGKVYIYSTADGSLLYTLSNPNAYSTSLNDNFGIAVGISNNYAIVSAYNEDDAGGTESGKVYIYSTANGSLLYTLNNPNAYGTSQADNFGYSVGICDNYAIVGVRSEDDAGGLDSGKAYIYSTTDGSLLYTLSNPNSFDTPANDNFGISVGISNNYAIVSAYLEDQSGATQSGKAYIYSTADGSLLYTLDNPNAYGTPVDDYFGYSVAITDQHAVVGAAFEDDAGGTTSGKVYLYSADPADHITIAGQGLTVSSVTALTTTIVIPTTAQAGNIAILFDTSTTVTDTIPSGWTSINGVTTTGIRTNISYKILGSGDAGTTITGMAGTTRKVLLVYRDLAAAISSISVSTVSNQATTVTPSNQTITGGTTPSIYFACYGKTTATAPTRGFTTGTGTATEYSSVSSSGLYVKALVYNEGPNALAFLDATISMTDAGTNTLQSFRIDLN